MNKQNIKKKMIAESRNNWILKVKHQFLFRHIHKKKIIRPMYQDKKNSLTNTGLTLTPTEIRDVTAPRNS